MNILLDKLKEVLFAVLPITVIVLLLHFTLVPLEAHVLVRFLLGAISIIIGLSVFLFGVDIGITPIGTHMGAALARSNKLWVITIAGLILGFFISIAEPDLQILAEQVASVTSGALSKVVIVVIVSVGIAVLLTAGLLRVVYNISLRNMFSILYFIILMLGLFSAPEFLAISFDASGATTGAMTVPFMLALAVGVSSLKKDGKASEEDSFGLVGIASAGAIISVLAASIIKNQDSLTGTVDASLSTSVSIIKPFLDKIPVMANEILIALLPLVVLFAIFNAVSFKLGKRQVIRITKGLVYTFIGLVLFLTGVNAGFMDVGSEVGRRLAAMDNKWIVIIVGFILGFVTIMAEPAVYVLTHQIEDVTSGYVKRKAVLSALSIGVGMSVALSMIRVLVPGVKLWHFLLPGYIISIALSYFVPKLFIGIAFDSGGVASGPMTATFILAFAQGAADAIEHADVLVDGFGVIAMVAMTPLIALQILGLIFKVKSAKGGISVNE